MSDAHRTCPYRGLPAAAYWRGAVAGIEAGAVDPASDPGFRLTPTSRIGTAGSCFAQHIARYLSQAGCNYFVTEPASPLLDAQTAAEFQYGTFSARFGNLYTSRQLLQLFRRAYGRFSPTEDAWEFGEGWVDPFRPSVQPRGFSSLSELHADRRFHLAAVRRLFEEVDCFVFTLGLTETWESIEDGAVFPVCPGCGYGSFDPQRYRHRNLGVDEVVADLDAFIAEWRLVNPQARLILTVSPVPLIATMGGTHVLQATTYSKSVLRVAAETVRQRHEGVAYFPSYEIITSAASRGAYFAEDLRSVTEDGVAHVMGSFFRHVMDRPDAGAVPRQPKSAASRAELSVLVSDVICDEEKTLG